MKRDRTEQKIKTMINFAQILTLFIFYKYAPSPSKGIIESKN